MSEKADTKTNTITIDDKEYNYDDLTTEQQGLVNIYRTWASELNDLRLEVAKGESALRDLTREITASVNEEVEDWKNNSWQNGKFSV